MVFRIEREAIGTGGTPGVTVRLEAIIQVDKLSRKVRRARRVE